MRKRAEKNTIVIDSEKLSEKLREYSLANGKVSYDGMAGKCGFSGSWLDNFIASGKMPLYATVLLDTVLGIHLSDYEVLPEKADDMQASKISLEENGFVYTTVYRACYDAMKQVLSERDSALTVNKPELERW